MMKKKLFLCLIASAMMGLSACGEDSEKCLEHATKCSADGVHMICKDKIWVSDACRPEQPICLDGTCVTCVGNQKRCFNNIVQICSNNRLWDTEKVCADKECNDKSYSCESVNCEKGWKRCNNHTVEHCDAPDAYIIDTENACTDGSYCLENSETHTTICVACDEGDQKCHASNGKLLVCRANGTWPKEGTACTEGQTCKIGAAECTKIEN